MNRRLLLLMRAKAVGLGAAIAGMSREERLVDPSAAFGANYNQLVQALRPLFGPDSGQLPPDVIINQENMTSTINASEIWAFCSQINEMITALLASEHGGHT